MSDRLEPRAHRVAARDANQQFSRLLRQVEAGEEVVITRRGEAVARLVPVDEREEKRVRAAEELHRILTKGYAMGGGTFDRDEAYDR